MREVNLGPPATQPFTPPSSTRTCMSLSPATSRTCSRNHDAQRGPRPWEEPVGKCVRTKTRVDLVWQLRTACEDDPFDVGFVGEFIACKVEQCQFTCMRRNSNDPSLRLPQLLPAELNSSHLSISRPSLNYTRSAYTMPRPRPLASLAHGTRKRLEEETHSMPLFHQNPCAGMFKLPRMAPPS